MADARPWTVLRHDPIEKHEDNLWSVVGDIPEMALRRRMVLARTRDGRVVVHNAIALDEAAMREVEAWGEPSVLIVPNGFHRLDAHAWKQRYPRSQVVCPPGADKAVRKVVEVDAHYDALRGDDTVRAETLDGVKGAEGVLVVTSGDRLTLVFNDVLFNQPHLPGFQGWVMKAIGSTGAPKVTTIARVAIVKDKAPLRAHMTRLAALPGVARVVPGHGDLLADPAATLRAVAAAL